jgi:hypothetical protein
MCLVEEMFEFEPLPILFEANSARLGKKTWLISNDSAPFFDQSESAKGFQKS